jgi:hypothetical protein
MLSCSFPQKQNMRLMLRYGAFQSAGEAAYAASTTVANIASAPTSGCTVFEARSPDIAKHVEITAASSVSFYDSDSDNDDGSGSDECNISDVNFNRYSLRCVVSDPSSSSNSGSGSCHETDCSSSTRLRTHQHHHHYRRRNGSSSKPLDLVKLSNAATTGHEAPAAGAAGGAAGSRKDCAAACVRRPPPPKHTSVSAAAAPTMDPLLLLGLFGLPSYTENSAYTRGDYYRQRKYCRISFPGLVWLMLLVIILNLGFRQWT